MSVRKKEQGRIIKQANQVLLKVNNWSFFEDKQNKNIRESSQTYKASQVVCRILIGKRKSTNGRLPLSTRTDPSGHKTEREGKKKTVKSECWFCAIFGCARAWFSLNQHGEECRQPKILRFLFDYLCNGLQRLRDRTGSLWLLVQLKHLVRWIDASAKW